MPKGDATESTRPSEWKVIGSLPFGEYDVVTDNRKLVIRQKYTPTTTHAADGWVEVAIRSVTRRAHQGAQSDE